MIVENCLVKLFSEIQSPPQCEEYKLPKWNNQEIVIFGRLEIISYYVFSPRYELEYVLHTSNHPVLL